MAAGRQAPIRMEIMMHEHSIHAAGPQQLKELSLFSGAGGGLLAGRLLGWRTIGYVEFNDYCQRVIQQRIADGFLDDAPIFGDVREFKKGGYAEAYAGYVDVISGGFP